MKKQVVKKQFNKQVIAKTNYSLLSHVLSPLEIMAHTKRYKPFQYVANNTQYFISQDFCYYLQAIAKAKTELFLKNKSKRIIPLNNHAPETFTSFIKTPISKHKLPQRLINQLHEQHIYKMSQVVFIGVHKLSALPYLKQSELDAIMQVLAKNDSLNLFLRSD